MSGSRIFILFSFFNLALGYNQSHAKSIEEHWAIWQDESRPDTSRLEALKLFTYNKFLFSEPDSALRYYEIMRDFAVEKEHRGYESDAIRYIGVTYHLRGNYVMSNDYYLKSLKVREEIKDTNRVASSYNDIAGVYQNQGEFDLAKQYYKKSIKLFKITGNKQGLGRGYLNIGSLYSDNQEFDTAAHYIEKSLELYQQTGLESSLAYSYLSLGLVYVETNKLDVAKEYILKCIELLEPYHDMEGLAAAYNGLFTVYFALGKYNMAQEAAEKAYAISTEMMSILEHNKSAFNLYRVHKHKGNYPSALEMLELHVELKDSIRDEESKTKTLQQKFEYDYAQKSLADSLVFAEEKRIAEIEREQEEKQQKQILFTVIGGLVLVVIFAVFIFNRLQLTRKQKQIIEAQKVRVEEAHQEIQDSIVYAKRIQNAILPPDKVVKEYLSESFILYKPKDIVAGDFYWMESQEGKVLFAAADCTGHGVPGAMVSVVCNNGLNRAVREHGITEPGKILDKTREIVLQEFEKSEEDVKDGMDIALCSLESNEDGTANLKYAGAHNPLWVIRKGGKEVEEIKADKQPIGKFSEAKPFTTHSVHLNPGDTFYIFSDGYADQFGGDKGKKLKAKNFKELLLSMQELGMQAQKDKCDISFETWRGNLEQLDDVCVIGVRV